MSLTKIVNQLVKFLPKAWQNTAKLRLFGIAKVRLINYVRPVILESEENTVEVKIPLTRFHLYISFNPFSMESKNFFGFFENVQTDKEPLEYNVFWDYGYRSGCIRRLVSYAKIVGSESTCLSPL